MAELYGSERVISYIALDIRKEEACLGEAKFFLALKSKRTF